LKGVNKRFMKKKSKLPVLLVILLLVGSNIANYWYFNIYCEGLYKEQAEHLSAELNSYQTEVYTANNLITAGTVVTEDMVTKTTGYVSSHIGLFKGNCIGKTAIADISAGAILSSSMVYDQSKELGNTGQYSQIDFPSNASIGSYVDIRIRFRNGNDYVVISKTKLAGIEGNNSLLTLTEEERLCLSSAIVDKNLYDATIYATVYSSPETQDPAIITYIPREDNLPLIYDNWREYSVLRKQLEAQIEAEVQ